MADNPGNPNAAIIKALSDLTTIPPDTIKAMAEQVRANQATLNTLPDDLKHLDPEKPEYYTRNRQNVHEAVAAYHKNNSQIIGGLADKLENVANPNQDYDKFNAALDVLRKNGGIQIVPALRQYREDSSDPDNRFLARDKTNLIGAIANALTQDAPANTPGPKRAEDQLTRN